MIRSTFYGFNSALSGMRASQMALDVTGNNMANIYTTGYTRQRLDLYSIAAPNYGDRYSSGSQSVGQGVGIGGVTQIRDPFLDMRFRVEAAELGERDAWLTGMNDVTKEFDTIQDKGFAEALANFRTELNKLASNAGNKDIDSVVRGTADALAKLLNQHAKSLEGIRDQEDYDLKNSTIPKVNSILDNIAKLNDSIMQAEIMGSPALELQDQRNDLLDQLSTYMKVNVSYSPTEISPGVIVNKMTIRFSEDNTNPMDFDVTGGIDDPANIAKGHKLLDGTEHATLSVSKNADGKTEIFSDWAKVNLSGPNGGSSSVALSFESGILKGTTDFLNKNGEYDTPPNTTRGIGYYQKTLDSFAREFANSFNNANMVKNPDYVNPPVDPTIPEFIGGPLFTNSKLPDPTPPYTPTDHYNDITAANIGVSKGWLAGNFGVTTTKPSTADKDKGGDENVLYMISLLESKQVFETSSIIHDAAAAVSAIKGVYSADKKLPSIPGTGGTLKDGDKISFSVDYKNQAGTAGRSTKIELTYHSGFLYGADGTKYPAAGGGVGATATVDGGKLNDAVIGELSKTGEFNDNFTVSKDSDGKLQFTAKAGGTVGGEVTGITLDYTNLNTSSALNGGFTTNRPPMEAYNSLNFKTTPPNPDFPIYDKNAADPMSTVFTIDGKKFAFVKDQADATALGSIGIRAVVMTGPAAAGTTDPTIAPADVASMAGWMTSIGLPTTVDPTDNMSVKIAKGTITGSANIPAGAITPQAAEKGLYQSGAMNAPFEAMDGDNFDFKFKYLDETGQLQNVNLKLTYSKDDNSLVAPDGRKYPATGAAPNTVTQNDLQTAITGELNNIGGVQSNFTVSSTGDGKLQFEAKTPGAKGAKPVEISMDFNTQRTTLNPGGAIGVVETIPAKDGYQTSNLSQFPPYDGKNLDTAVFLFEGQKYAFAPAPKPTNPADVNFIEMVGTGSAITTVDVDKFIAMIGNPKITLDPAGSTTIKFPPDLSIAGSGNREVFKGTFAECFSNIGITAAADVNTKNSELTNHTSLLNGVSDLRDGLSSVDMNEEGVNLMRYQKSFTAAARVMTTMDEALDTIINKMGIVGR